MTRRFLVSAMLSAVLSCSALSVQAEPSDRASAEALFRAGREANARGDFATACQRFEESNRLEPAAGTILNIANCREKLGQLASAWQRYREAVQKLPAGDERITIAETRASALEAKLPRLTLTLGEGVPADATIQRDGIELGRGSLGVALPVDPGEHTLVVRAPGYEPATQTITLAQGQQRVLALALGRPLPPRAAPEESAQGALRRSQPFDYGPALHPVPAEPERSGRRTAGFVLGGVGIAGLAVSAITGALVLSKKRTVQDECVNHHCTQAGLDAGDSGRTLATVSTVAFIAGAASLGAAFVLVLTDKRGHETTLEPRALRDGGGVELRGRF